MQQSKKTLVIGATPKPYRYAYIATEMLLKYNHPLVLYGVKRGSISDNPILNDWYTTQDIDTVTLYINPSLQEQYLKKIIELKPKRIIFNPGTENLKLKELAEANNIEAQYACTLVMLRTGQF